MKILILLSILAFIARLLWRLMLSKYNRGRYIKRNREIRIFDHYYLDGKALFLHLFREIPCQTAVDNVDATKAFEHLRQYYGGQIVNIYQHNTFDHDKDSQHFVRSYFILDRNVIVETGDGYANVLYVPQQFDYASILATALHNLQKEEKQEQYEMNIICSGMDGFYLKPMPVTPTPLDVELYYNDDFKEVDELVKRRLNSNTDKGIVLFHGLPGTGKTTYLRYLIGQLHKKVLFVSPSVAGNLVSPDFINILIDNPNSVLIIEDAENIIMDRRRSGTASVSNLLNISDGLLSDCLNVQIVCTFNSELSMIDEALLRKGRLIVKYEFGKLNTEKAKRLSKYLGHYTSITQPMTLAEITHPGVQEYTQSKPVPIGFRREVLEMEA
jgi:hypothetical protein